MSQSKLSVGQTQYHDEITLYWTIPNFKKLFEVAKAAKLSRIAEEKFTVGGKNWGFHLSQSDPEDVSIHMDFYGPDMATAEFTVYSKSSKGEFIHTMNLGFHKYALKASNIKGATHGWRWQRWKSLSELQNEGFLADGTLSLKFTVSVCSTNALMRKQASKDLKKGLDSAVGSDFTFVFVEEGSEKVIDKIKAHRAILSLRSSVFATMFGIGMKEAKDGKVEIGDMTPKAMRILLNYIYSGEVDEEWGSVAEELFYGADKYELDQLKDFLCENIHSALTARNVWKIRSLAKLYKFPQVLKSTMKFIKKNTEEVVENVEEVTLKIEGK